jgi:predicted nucleic acid-binding protein
MNLFLDSSAIIKLFKNNQKTVKIIEGTEKIYTSTICAYEVLLGEECMNNRRKSSLIEKVQNFFETATTLSLTYKNMVKASAIAGKLLAKGKKIDDFDISIAAQALENNAVVLTKDIKHFEILREETGLAIEKIS